MSDVVSDPWADVRERLNRNAEMLEGEPIGDIGKAFQEVRQELDCRSLLTDADALLAVMREHQRSLELDRMVAIEKGYDKLAGPDFWTWAKMAAPALAALAGGDDV